MALSSAPSMAGIDPQGVAETSQDPQPSSEPGPESQPLPLQDYQSTSDDAEESPWARKTVLSFDGGGVRGYSSLLILKRLMELIRRLELELSGNRCTSSEYYNWTVDGHFLDGNDSNIPRSHSASGGTTDNAPLDRYLPCHYFDYMVGTSTGGLSAIMLGRLRMSVDEALDQYTAFGNNVFGRARICHEKSYLWWPRAKFSSTQTKGALCEIIFTKMRRSQPDYDPEMASQERYKSRSDRTRTMVYSFSFDRRGGLTNKPHVWRTFDNEQRRLRRGTTAWQKLNPGLACDRTIWEVCRATSAAPRYFESIKIGKKKHLDGAMCYNNPSLPAAHEIVDKHPHPPAYFLSIGTGVKPDGSTAEYHPPRWRDFARHYNVDQGSRRQFIRKYAEWGKRWKDFMTDTERPANEWNAYCQLAHIPRDRFSVPDDIGTGMWKIPLDDWRPVSSGETTLADIRRDTLAYLSDDVVNGRLTAVAQSLVEIRHRRARTERWESFATEITYQCPGPTCTGLSTCKGGPDMTARNRLRQHMRGSHRVSDGLVPTESFLSNCRV